MSGDRGLPTHTTEQNAELGSLSFLTPIRASSVYWQKSAHLDGQISLNSLTHPYLSSN